MRLFAKGWVRPLAGDSTKDGYGIFKRVRLSAPVKCCNAAFSKESSLQPVVQMKQWLVVMRSD